MVNQFAGSTTEPPQFTRGYGLAFGHAERKAMAWPWSTAHYAPRSWARMGRAPAQDQEFVLYHCDNVEATGFVEHLKLPHYVDFQAELELVRGCGGASGERGRGRPPNDRAGYNFAYLDEQTKRMIRRAMLKAVAIPGYQVPFGVARDAVALWLGHRRHPGHRRVIGPGDVLKVIDQGADDTTNAVSIRRFFARTAGVRTTDAHRARPRIIQTRHRIPETPLREGQILVYQVPIPEPLRMLEPRETETRSCTRWPNTA